MLLGDKQSLSLGHTERRNLGAEYCRAGQVSSDTNEVPQAGKQAEPQPSRCGSVKVSASVSAYHSTRANPLYLFSNRYFFH